MTGGIKKKLGNDENNEGTKKKKFGGRKRIRKYYNIET